MQTIMRTATSILGLLRVSDSNHNCLLGPRSILGRGRWVCPLPAAENDPEAERYGTLLGQYLSPMKPNFAPSLLLLASSRASILPSQ